jgi:hypothetical protein
MADPPSTSFLQGRGYKAIDEGAQQDKLADRKPRDGYNGKVTRSRIKHPVRDLVGTAIRLADQEVTNTVVLVLPDHQHGPARQRMKRIGNHGFECQKPGIMLPVRTKAAKTGPAWRH